MAALFRGRQHAVHSRAAGVPPEASVAQNDGVPQTNVTFGVRTDVGGHREHNEDAVLAAPPIFLVADGMGGHAAGEVAAAIAVQRLGSLAGQDQLRPEDIVRAVAEANDTILAEEAEDRGKAGMGTTVTGVCLGVVAGTPHWFVFNVGDSRVYRYADAALSQVTVDHSEVAELVASGRITEEQARVHPLRNVITRSLGMYPAPVPDIWVLPVVVGERFLVCSDGLTNEVTDAQITDVLAQDLPAQQTADVLIEMAVDHGGRDNVSAVVVDVPMSEDLQPVDVTTAPRRDLG
jgi:protein phosphatase